MYHPISFTTDRYWPATQSGVIDFPFGTVKLTSKVKQVDTNHNNIMISSTARLVSRTVARTSVAPRAFAAQGPTRSMAGMKEKLEKKVSA